MLGTNMRGNFVRPLQLTERALGVANRESLDLVGPMSGHERGHRTGIHAAAQENSNWNIAHQVADDRALQQLTVAPNVFSTRKFLGSLLQFQVPITLNVQLSRFIEF